MTEEHKFPKKAEDRLGMKDVVFALDFVTSSLFVIFVFALQDRGNVKILINDLINEQFLGATLGILAISISVYVAIISFSPVGFIRWLVKLDVFSTVESVLSYTVRLTLVLVLYQAVFFASLGMTKSFFVEAFPSELIRVCFLAFTSFTSGLYFYWVWNVAVSIKHLLDFGKRKVVYEEFMSDEAGKD